MMTCPRPAPSRRRSGERGFTMVELALTFTVIAIMSAMMIPKFGRIMESTRVNRNAAIVAGDLEAAFTLAARYRKPMRLSYPGGTSYNVADLTGGTVRLRRTLGEDSDLGSLTMTFSATPIDIYPSGVSTGALNVVISSGASSKTIRVTTAGFVRIQ